MAEDAPSLGLTFSFSNLKKLSCVLAFPWLCRLPFLFKSDPSQRGVHISQSDRLVRVGFNYPGPSLGSHPEEISVVEDLNFILKGGIQ